MLLNKILPAAKAWAALIGAILTALVGTLTPEDAGYRVLTMALAIVTAVAVYGIPNADKPKGDTVTPQIIGNMRFVNRGDRGALTIGRALAVLAVALVVAFVAPDVAGACVGNMR